MPRAGSKLQEQVSWCEVTLKVHPKHSEIVKMLASEINAGTLKTQAEAVDRDNELLESL